MESLLSVSAAGSSSASTQYLANTVAFFSVPDFVAAITPRPGRSSACSAPPLALVVSTTSWRLRRDLIAHRGDLSGRHIRSHKIELVLHAVERTVTNQDESKVVRRFSITRHRVHRLL